MCASQQYWQYTQHLSHNNVHVHVLQCLVKYAHLGYKPTLSYFDLKDLQGELWTYVLGGLIKEVLDYKPNPTFVLCESSNLVGQFMRHYGTQHSFKLTYLGSLLIITAQGEVGLGGFTGELLTWQKQCSRLTIDMRIECQSKLLIR